MYSRFSGYVTHSVMSARGIFLTDDKVADSVNILSCPRTSWSSTACLTAGCASFPELLQ